MLRSTCPFIVVCSEYCASSILCHDIVLLVISPIAFALVMEAGLLFSSY